MECSSLRAANSALREGRFEDALALYAVARQEVPELSGTIDFNVDWMGLTLQKGEKNSVVAASALEPPVGEALPSGEVLVIVRARKLARAGETARLFSRRALHHVGIVTLLDDGDPAPEALAKTLRTSGAKFALIVDEGVLPARDWLRYAHNALRHFNGDGVLANTGMATGAPVWMNVLAPPSLLVEALESGGFGEAKVVVCPDFLLADVGKASRAGLSKSGNPSSVHLVEVSAHQKAQHWPRFAEDVCVIMPSVDIDRASRTAQLLHDRAGMSADIIIAHDVGLQGFIPTLNQVALRSDASWVVYLAEDAIPGAGWLRRAHTKLLANEKSLLAFNCGKWHGRVASFGMIKKSWAYELYGPHIMYEGYQSHRADNEITAIARAQDQFLYAPECVLVEHDLEKDFRSSERAASNFRRDDARLFRRRFEENFGGVVTSEQLEDLREEYLDLKSHYARLGPAISNLQS